MRLVRSLPLAFLFYTVSGQDTITSLSDATAALTAVGDAPPSSQRSYGSTRTVEKSDTSTDGSMSVLSSSVGAANSTGSIMSSQLSSSTSVTLLVGGQRTTSTLNGTALSKTTASQTSSIAQPTNTTPCNGHPAFCSRRYSNITHVAAHNSPFSRPGNAASNQALDVEYQLEDGIRMRKSPFIPLASLS